MPEVKERMTSSQWWWFDCDNKNDNTSTRSPWLHSALAELDEKTKGMLRIIEEDADSFAKRAEMYYKKRPELISMVREFYRDHRSLAERFDQLRADPTVRHNTPWALSSLSFKHQQEQNHIICSDKSYDSYFETYDPMETCESDVDDPEQEPEQDEEHVLRGLVDSNEATKLKGEIERLEKENRIQKQKLEEKNEEKREVIRQLSIAIDALKEENIKLRKIRIVKEIPSEVHKLKDMFMRKLFKSSPK